MNIKTYTGLVGFLLVLSALNLPAVTAATHQSETNHPSPTIEDRLSRLTAEIRQRESQVQDSTQFELDQRIAAWADGSGDRGAVVGPAGRGWADGAGGRSWGNAVVGGTATGPGGTFANARPWVNGGWVNGGGFYNYYKPSVTFVNY